MVLINAFTNALSDSNRIHSAQVAALVRAADIELDVEMQSARKAVSHARAAILKHDREHGRDALLPQRISADSTAGDQT
jgi:hypothetical protein